MLNFKTLLADAPLPNPTVSPPSPQADPLIDQGAQVSVYVGAALLVLGIAVVVGLFSRRVEHALITAFILSLCLIAFFAFTR